ncbi:hypothetical protein AAFF_G00024300 [Aldrovandia affinis]|uniref:Uncharacterized protein n=1 Tax=Aldrovandia affinis TaxID=143900 RepID=A0AAD7T6T7_9TELE|nr:hypothetical protein AAFF_G00024300 [Aldrovandia affinis]
MSQHAGERRCTSATRPPTCAAQRALDHISGSRLFSSLDLRSSYWQVELALDAWPKTHLADAFITIGQGPTTWQCCAYIEPQRTTFTIVGALQRAGTFERLKERVLNHVLKQHCIVYLDNLFVHTGTCGKSLLPSAKLGCA